MFVTHKLGIKIEKYLFESIDKINRDADLIVITCFEDYFNKLENKKYFEEDNCAVLNLTTYEDWWAKIGNKTRNMIRKAEKQNLVCEIKHKLTNRDINDIFEIYTETPIRQNRFSPYYRIKKQNISQNAGKNGLFFLAKKDSKIVGYIHLLITNANIANINTILSLKRAFFLAPNNFLISEVVRYCTKQKITRLTYGRMNIPALNKFKENNGFVKEKVYIVLYPLTLKGKLARLFRIYKNPKDFIPNSLKHYFIPLYNFFSRLYAKVYVTFFRVKVDT